MATITTTQATTCTCAACKMEALERVRYFPRQLLTVDDMVAEQTYFREKLRRHNRYLHGTGVVCGLIVSPAPIAGAPWRVQISEGYALGPYGDEIYVASTVFLDLARCAAGDQTDPCDPSIYNRAGSGVTRELLVGIKYAECFAKPVRSMAGGCGCDDAGCEYSRIRDSFELGCMPIPTRTPRQTICELLSARAGVPCPPDPTDPWVLLAVVRAPASTEATIAEESIVNAVRTNVFSTTMIQQQVIQCCCKPTTVAPAPVQVTSVAPADKTSLSVGPGTVVVTFNKSLQSASVTAQTIIVTGSNGLPVTAGSVSYNAASNSATFTPAARITTGSYIVTAKGAGAVHIIDSDNLALDGKGDGVAGSDHVTAFSVVEIPK